MNFFKTLRGKLTLLFFISTAVITVVTISLLLLTTRNLIDDQVNHHLHIVIQEAKKIVEENHNLNNEDALKNLVSAQGMTVILLSTDGTPILQTNSYDVSDISQHQMQQIIFSSTDKEEPKHFRVNEIYFATMPVTTANFGDGTLAVGFSTKIINTTFNKIITTTSLTLFFTVIIISILWQLIIKRYLYPLEKIAKKTHNINNSNDLNQRIIVHTSVTEIKNIANSFNKLLERLYSVFEIEHTFFSDTAHSLKTPLAVIRSYIETLPKQSTKQKTDILDNIDLLNNTIQDLLLISKIHSQNNSNIKRINLSNIVEQIAELTQTIGIEKNISVSQKIQEKIYIQADESLLTKAISNIVKNAVDHEKKNGNIIFSLKKTNRKVALIISDTGSGIKKTDINKVFSRFYKASNSRSKNSSGLGLAITKAVIESFGGKIKIKSSINSGTKVFILFSY